jgi:polysaccharide deacetylase family protein (PEP-CTERM system associated)
MPNQYTVNRRSFNLALGIYRPILDNMLTFEVEDRFHVECPDIEPPDARSRIIPLIMHLLDILDEQKAKATFFTLGWVARKFPEVVALVDSRGHEVASHGFTHGNIMAMTSDKFKNELVRSKELLENIIGKPIRGYKAASPYIGGDSLSQYRLISEAGYLYDCSLLADNSRIDSQKPITISIDNQKSIIAIPQSIRRKWGVVFRFGENLRILPGWFGLNSLKSLNDKHIPAMINMKLWEIDSHYPKSTGAEYVRYSRYGNISLAEEKLNRLLDYFRFTTCAEVLNLSDEI